MVQGLTQLRISEEWPRGFQPGAGLKNLTVNKACISVTQGKKVGRSPGLSERKLSTRVGELSELFALNEP